MNKTEKKQNNRKIIIKAFVKYIKSIDDGKKLYQLRKYVEKFNNIDEHSQFLVMRDMFDTYKAKVIEGEQATRERRHEREAEHEFGEWKETTYTKTCYDSRIGRERPLRCKIWTRTCLECGYTDFQKNMPYEVKLEKEARAKLLVRRKNENYNKQKKKK